MSEAKKLGEMLKEVGLIDDFQLQTALSHQRNWGGKLGSILIELAFVTEEDVAAVIADKLHIPYVNLFEPEVPESVIKMIKADIAKKYHVVPVKKEGGALVLAMFDPFDIEAADEIRFITGLNIKPSLAMESEIQDAIRKYYDGEEVNRSHVKLLYHRRGELPSKMEIIHEKGHVSSRNAETEPSSPLISKETAALQTLNDTKIRLDALISILIEKKIITREELVSMIYQKKIGL